LGFLGLGFLGLGFKTFYKKTKAFFKKHKSSLIFFKLKYIYVSKNFKYFEIIIFFEKKVNFSRE
jgi:hypothetical protein